MRNRHLLAVFDMPSVETLVLRRQAMLLGHLARMDPERLQLQMLAGRRIEPGQGAGGCRGPSLMGVFGPAGVYQGIRDRCQTWEARRTHFRGRRGDWWELAQRPREWRSFVESIYAIIYIEYRVVLAIVSLH